MSRFGEVSMLRHTRFLSIFILMGILFSAAPAGQFNPVTLFGPEVFIRGKGTPVTETYEFLAIDFEAPFMIHVRNGDDDGNNRVSSAEVWLNGGLLLGPSNFSQQVWGYDLIVDLKNENKLEVKLKSKPNSFLKIWFDGFPIDPFAFQSALLLPGGGTYYLANGIVLEVPEGAVSEPTEVQMRRVSEEEVMPILTSYGLNEKFFLSGFIAEPPSFQYNEPIRISIPSYPLPNATCLPYRYIVDLEHNFYSPGNMGEIEAPSEVTSVMLQPPPHDFVNFKVNCPKLGEKGKPTVELNIKEHSPEKRAEVAAAVNKLLSESDCDDEPCRCCWINVVSEFRDYSASGDCQHIIDEGYVEFLNCGDPPPREHWRKEELHMGEPYIIPEKKEADLGERVNFEAGVLDAKGKKIEGYPVQVISEPTNVIHIVDFNQRTGIGYFRAVGCGETTLKTVVRCGEQTKSTGDKINVNIHGVFIEPPESRIIYSCEELELKAVLEGFEGGHHETESIEWSSSNPSVADVNPKVGKTTVLTPDKNLINPEIVTIKAKSCDKDKSIDINILPALLKEIKIDPPEANLLICQRPIPMTASALDSCDEEMQGLNFTWSCDPKGAVEIIGTGSSVQVEPKQKGQVWILAEAEGEIGKAELEILDISKVEINPPFEGMRVGAAKTLTAKIIDEKGSEVQDLLGCPIVWSPEKPDIVGIDFLNADNPTIVLVQGLKVGKTKIFADVAGKRGEATVHVSDKELYRLMWSASLEGEGTWYTFKSDDRSTLDTIKHNFKFDGQCIIEIENYARQNILELSTSFYWYMYSKTVNWQRDYGTSVGEHATTLTSVDETIEHIKSFFPLFVVNYANGIPTSIDDPFGFMMNMPVWNTSWQTDLGTWEFLDNLGIASGNFLGSPGTIYADDSTGRTFSTYNEYSWRLYDKWPDSPILTRTWYVWVERLD